MSESASEKNNAFTQDEVTDAEFTEQSALNDSQKTYLMRRVVILRVSNTRLQKENAWLTRELEMARNPPEEISDKGKDKTDNPSL